MSDQFQLHLTPETELDAERARQDRETRYRRQYWQKYKQTHERVCPSSEFLVPEAA
ncbi:MAG: hypothetical protein L3J36_16880 [Rhodobacteraceae bacterium]|nr:hypothetical protein [Paracoccaceae bacterium]